MAKLPSMYGGIVLSGADPLIAKLVELPSKVFRKGLLSASRKAMRPVVAQAKATAPRETGTLKQSIGIKIKTYPKRGTVVTIVGPRAGFGIEYEGRKRDPVYYAHLQEGGHRVVAANTLGTRFSKKVGNLIKVKGSGAVLGRVPPRPFLQPALKSNQAVVVAILRTELAAFVAKEAAKESGAAPSQPGRRKGTA